MDKGIIPEQVESSKEEEREPGPRTRALTAKGLQYQGSILNRELISSSRALSRHLDTLDAAIADGCSMERARELRNEAMTKNDTLVEMHHRLTEGDLALPDVDTRVYDKILDRYTLALQGVNKFILDQRLETQSNASKLSGASIGSRSASPKAEVSADLSVEKLADALSRATTRRLPVPEPDVFDGDRFSFTLWLQSFEAMIEEQVDDKADCLFYLNRYLRGEPKDMVRGLIPLRRADAYWKAKQMLSRRYGDPFTTFDAYRQRLYDWPKIAANDGAALQRFSDFLEHCAEASSLLPALKSLDDPRENQRLLKKLPLPLSARWATFVDDWREKTLTENHGDNIYAYPPFVEFVAFVRKQARIACDPITSSGALRESLGCSAVRAPRRGNENSCSFLTQAARAEVGSHPYRQSGQRNSVQDLAGVGSVSQCGVCEAEHLTENCRSLLEASMDRRVDVIRKKGLCFRCLRRGHVGRTCRSGSRCATCGGAHATLLHRDTVTAVKVVDDRKQSVVTNAARVNTCDRSVSHSLIVPVWLSHVDKPDHSILTYAVLDEQSDASFITEACVEQLSAPGRKTRLKISTLTGDRMVDTSKVNSLRIQGFSENQIIELSAYTRADIPSKREHIPRSNTTGQWPHLQMVAAELMPYSDAVSVGLLIGTDCSAALRPVDVVVGGPMEPYAVKTVLGWGVVGRMAAVSSSQDNCVSVGCFKTVTRCKEMFEACSLQESGKPYSYEDMKFIDLMEQGVHRLSCGRFEAPLPIRSLVNLPDNRGSVMNRLMKLKRRLCSDEMLFNLYNQAMTTNLENGFISEVQPQLLEVENRWYLPHHAINYRSESHKFRIVFDCSAEFGGHSLNQHLMSGPDLANNLVGVLLRFREERVAVACDIEKMFHQVSINPEHRKYVRFLWWRQGDISTCPVDYEMKVHLFGASSSPSVANFVLKRAAVDGADGKNDKAVEFIMRDFYVDDGLTSVPTVTEAVELIQDSKDICSRAGFNAHKFMSNEPLVLEQMNQEEVSPNLRNLDVKSFNERTECALGLQWNVGSDRISFRSSQRQTPATRRGLLSSVYSIYDPLGLIAPVTLRGKFILQDLCRSGAQWDDPVSENIHERWSSWRADLKGLNELGIARCYKPKAFGEAVNRELHHFSDASSLGYGQCSYLRQVSASDVCVVPWWRLKPEWRRSKSLLSLDWS